MYMSILSVFYVYVFLYVYVYFVCVLCMYVYLYVYKYIRIATIPLVATNSISIDTPLTATEGNSGDQWSISDEPTVVII